MEDQTVLSHGLILADPDLPEVVPHGRTIISGDRLVAVNIPDTSPLPASEVIDCSGCLIMPGLVNCHTHAAMSFLRGLADDLPLDRWLHDYIFPSEAKHAGPDFVYWGTALSAVEMALGGITTFADGYFHMEHAAQAAVDVGLRAVIAQGVLDVRAPDAERPGSWRDRAGQFLDSCPRNSLVRCALFCHSPYLCGPETYLAAAELCAKHDGLLFSHVAETASEVAEVTRQYGLAPVEHLSGLGILGPTFVAVHAVHLSERERELIVKSGTRVVHCPESNMKLASGAAPVSELLRRGVTIGIGTDGPGSNNNLDMFEEMRSASLLAKLVNSDPEALAARVALRMATMEGARVLGMDSEIGSLKAGKLADVIVIDFNRPHLTPLYHPISHLVYSARGSDVRDVLVNGRIVVRGGEVTTVDQERVKGKVAEKALDIGRELGLKNYGVHEPMAKKITYKDAGVDVELAGRVIDSLGDRIRSTFRPEVMGKMGGFAALFHPEWSRYGDPVLVSATDGVGTKLKIAFLTGIHHTVGIDLVAMSVNDILVTGAEPLFFLDYFATGAIDPETVKSVISGVAAGCEQAGCALIGGETAEMPDFYDPGEYDLAGFCVGIVDRGRAIDGSAIKPGDQVIGVASSGLHSNGFSLVRKVLLERKGYSLESHSVELGRTLAEELLSPTLIYVKPVLDLLAKSPVSGIAHITGGGFTGNIPRIVPDACTVTIRKRSWDVPRIFDIIQREAGLDDGDMFGTFNMGIGLVLIVPRAVADQALAKLGAAGMRAWIIGAVAPRPESGEAIRLT